jgi:amidohydrolase
MTIQSLANESVDVVTQRATHLLAGLEDRLPALGELYRDLHRHPELSMQEHRTAGVVAQHLRDSGYEVTEGIGKTGVVGLLRNGAGPVVMLRGDMDALPIKEQTGVDYASEVFETTSEGSKVPIMHACGHDTHVTCLIATAEILAKKSEAWRGTAFICAQPAEETGQGAEAMLRDGLFKRFPRPDICLGQHVLPLAAGMVGHNAGVIMSASINVGVRLFGKGGHGSAPQVAIDPVIMASSLIMKLQTVRSRELAGDVPAVITIGFVNAGIKHNVIPDEAHIGLNIRTQSTNVQEQIISAIRYTITMEILFLTVFGYFVVTHESAIMPPQEIALRPRCRTFPPIISPTSHRTQNPRCVLEFMPSPPQHWHTCRLLVLSIRLLKDHQLISEIPILNGDDLS